MKLNIKNTNVSVSAEAVDYLEKKLMSLDKIVDFSRDNVLVNAELGKLNQHHKHGDIFRAEVTLHIGGRDYRAVSEGSDLYSAIDAVKDQLGREVKSGKDKKRSVFRRGAQKIKNMLKFGRGK